MTIIKNIYTSFNRWFGLRLDFFCFLFINSLVFVSVLLASSKRYCQLNIIQISITHAVLNAGLLGLALSYSLSLIMHFQFFVKLSAEVESVVSNHQLIVLIANTFNILDDIS